MTWSEEERGGDDIVQSSMSELILFLFFVSFLMFGAYIAVSQNAPTGTPPEPEEAPVLTEDQGTPEPERLPGLGLNIPSQEITFERGKYVLEDPMNTKLAELADAIKKQIDRYDGQIKYIDVIGHTDQLEHTGTSTSNLDKQLLLMTNDMDNSQTPSRADNAGLGLMRAVQVASYLEDYLASHESPPDPMPLIMPYSAGPLIIVTDGENALARYVASPTEDETRRRIEVRFRAAKAEAQ